MKNVFKKGLSILLAITIVLTSAYVGLNEIDFSEIKFNEINFSGVGRFLKSITPDFLIKSQAVSSGTCGDNLTWTLDDAGTLTISGTGNMKDYSYSSTPWYYIRESIKVVVVNSGVTSIAGYAFYDCKSLTSIYVNENNDCYSSVDGVLFNEDKTTLILYPEGNTRTSYTIPNSVTSIGCRAFARCSYLTSVTIPDSVTSIGDSAFNGCTSLTSITIPDSVTIIGSWAFANCTSLTSVYITDIVTWCNIDFYDDYSNPLCYGKNLYLDGELVKELIIPEGTAVISDYAFYNCKSPTSITIPDSVTSIGDSAFSGCTSLTSITIPDSVTSIRKAAFSGCTSLESITIPDSVTNIGSSTFKKCTSLTSITIPGSVTSIGASAFSSCTSLTAVYINDIAAWCGINFEEDSDGSCSSNPLRYAENLYINGELAKDIVIPDGVTSIGSYAFKNCTSLTSITIPGSVTSIGASAFEDCKVNSVYIDDVKSWCGIDFEMYYHWQGGRITYGYNSNPLWNGAKLYLNNQLVEKLVIPGTVEEIKDCAFLGCTSIKSLKFEKGVKTIGEKAFDGCKNLSSVTLPNTVKKIKGLAFGKCNIKEVYAESLRSWCGISFEIYKKVTRDAVHEWNRYYTIDRQANPLNDGGKFYINNKLIEDHIVIPEGVKSLKAYFLDGCENITEITIPKSVTRVSDYAFRGCENIGYVYCYMDTAGDKLAHEKNITHVHLDDADSENIKSGKFGTLNWSVNKVTRVLEFSSKGVIPDFSGVNAPWYEYYSYIKTIKINKGVTKIGARAFVDCKNITEITIPDGVTSIGYSAFNGCENLAVVKLSDTVENISTSAFSGCTKLSDLSLGNGVKTICKSAFYNCDSLESVIIPKTATLVDSKAFADCEKLQKVVVYSKKCEFNINCGLNYNHKIYGLKGSTAEEFATQIGAEFIDVETIHSHTYKTTTKKATLTANGSEKTVCTICGNVKTNKTIRSPKKFTLSTKDYTYNGKVKKPSVVVKDSKGKVLKKDTDYTVKYESGRKLPGKYTVTITFKGKYSGTKKLYFTIAPKTPTKLKASQTTTTITLSWAKVTDANGYRVYMYNSKTKKYKKLKDVKTTKLKISKLKAGTKYKFKVKAYTKDGDAIWSAYSSAFETSTKTKTPSITSLTSPTKGKAVIKWSNVSGESGYQVYYSTSKTGTYKKVASYKANKTAGSKSKLKSRKTYYFKVRTYKKTSDRTIYSGWSTVKKVKIK